MRNNVLFKFFTFMNKEYNIIVTRSNPNEYRKIFIILICFFVFFLISPFNISLLDSNDEISNDEIGNESENKMAMWKKILIGTAAIIAAIILAEIIRRKYFSGGTSTLSIDGGTPEPSSVPSSVPSEPKSVPVSYQWVNQYQEVGRTVYNYLLKHNEIGYTDVGIDFVEIQRINSYYGFNIFNIQSQTEIAVVVGELFTSYGYSLQKASYIAHRYMACIQIWEQMANNPQYQGVPAVMFYDTVHKMALTAANG